MGEKEEEGDWTNHSGGPKIEDIFVAEVKALARQVSVANSVGMLTAHTSQ
jgi:hypothetical protein